MPVFHFQFKIMKRSCQFIFIGKICLKKRSSVWYCFQTYFTVFLFSLDISWKFLTLCVFPRNMNKFSIIGGDIPLMIWQISLISTCKFLWWNAISLDLLSKLLKLLWLSPLTVLKDLSCTLLIKLFGFLEQNIQISGQ